MNFIARLIAVVFIAILFFVFSITEIIILFIVPFKWVNLSMAILFTAVFVMDLFVLRHMLKGTKIIIKKE